jgi:hypothetical protein
MQTESLAFFRVGFVLVWRVCAMQFESNGSNNFDACCNILSSILIILNNDHK